jgi:hypothetical protein
MRKSKKLFYKTDEKVTQKFWIKSYVRFKNIGVLFHTFKQGAETKKCFPETACGAIPNLSGS